MALMDAYLVYFFLVFCLVLATGLFVTRNRWIHRLTLPAHLYARLPASFQTDIEDGLSSDTFNLAENVQAADSRSGLNDAAKTKIRRIMRRHDLTFDEARKRYMEQRFAENNIGTDGLPRDPRFVSFS